MPTDVRTAIGARLAASISRLLSRAAAPPATKASATGPLIAFDHLRRPVWTPRDYEAFAREGFMQNAIVYRCVRMIAECAASVPLILYAGDDEIESHPLLSLVSRPNPLQAAPDVFESFYGHLLVSGNAYLEAVAIDDDIRELHSLRPDRMKVVPGPDGWPEAYEYTVAGRTVRIAHEPAPGIRPILHMKLFHAANDHYGMSPLEAAATAIDLHNTAAAWNKALLDNSARPSGALVYTARDGNLTTEQYERLKSELEAGFQGSANAGRPLLLEGGLDWKSMSLSPKDMDFIEARHVAAREIALALGVPPMLLGIPGDNTYSNMAEAQRIFWRQTVLPLVNRVATALSSWLAPAYDPVSGFSLTPPLELRPDLDQLPALAPEREALWTQLEQSSFLTTNEKRAAAGYSALTGGDEIKRAFVDLDPKANFNPGQIRDNIGRWTGDGGGSTDGAVLVNSPGTHQYSVNLDEEELGGGHTKRDHVGKTDDYLISEVKKTRLRVGPVKFGNKQEGSFDSVTSANDFVNRILEAKTEQVDAVARGDVRLDTLNMRFGYATGREGYKASGSAEAVVRPTYEVRIVIRHDKRSPRGYRVLTAFPRNRLPGEKESD